MQLFNYIDRLHKNLGYITYEAFSKIFGSKIGDLSKSAQTLVRPVSVSNRLDGF